MKPSAFRVRARAALSASPRSASAWTFALALAFGLAPGCADKEKPTGTTAPVVVTALEPIPAPPGLVAEIFIPSPEAFWKEARVTVGGPALILPQSIGGFMTSVLGLPITTAGEFDANLPVLGAAVEEPGAAQPRVAIGLHVKAGDRLVDQLTRGEAARFAARVDPGTQITFLEPKGTVKGPAVMGVLGNYLLVGREAADLTAAGPYAVRTLSKREATPKEDVAIEIPEAALAGPIVKWIERLGDMTKGTASPSVSLLPLERIRARMVEIAPDLTRARVTLDLDQTRARLRISGKPKGGGGPAEAALRDMTAGDLAPLRSLPGGSLLGILDREGAAARSANAASHADLLARGMGGDGKLAAEDREALAAALRAIGEARGDWIALGASFGSTGPLAYAHGAVSDQEKLGKAIKDFFELAKRPSIKAWLKEKGFTIKTKKTVLENVPGDVQLVTIARVAEEKDAARGGKPASGKDAKGKAGSDAGSKDAKDAKDAKAGPPPGEVPGSVDLFYLIRKDGLFAAAGLGAKEGLADLLRATSAGPGEGSVEGVPELKGALDAVSGDASFALFLDPLRLIASRAGKPGAGSSAPVLIALGRDTGAEGGIWLRVDVAVLAIQEAVKYRGAL